MIGTPHERWVEQVTAVVVPSGPGVTAEDVAAWCATNPNLGGMHRPRRIEIVDALPRTGSGKLNRPELRNSSRDGGYTREGPVAWLTIDRAEADDALWRRSATSGGGSVDSSTTMPPCTCSPAPGSGLREGGDLKEMADPALEVPFRISCPSSAEHRRAEADDRGGQWRGVRGRFLAQPWTSWWPPSTHVRGERGQGGPRCAVGGSPLLRGWWGRARLPEILLDGRPGDCAAAARDRAGQPVVRPPNCRSGPGASQSGSRPTPALGGGGQSATVSLLGAARCARRRRRCGGPGTARPTRRRDARVPREADAVWVGHWK